MKKKFIVVILVGLIICSICYIVKAENISDLEAQKEQIKQELGDVSSTLEDLQVELSDSLRILSQVEAQIVDGEAELEKTNQELDNIKKEIFKTQEKLNIVEKNYENQKNMCEKRLVALYEMGETTFLDVLLNAKSITDFISKYYLIEEIAEYDNQLLETILREKKSIEDIKEQIEQRNENLKSIQLAQEKTLIALENARTIRNSYTNTLTEEEQNLKNKINEYESKLNTLDSQILFLTLGEIDENFVGGEFTWPTPGYKTITSDYGTRFHPILKKYRKHCGIDIGAPMGAYVVAANSGVVTNASYLGEAGNAVIIDHGGGVSTLYAHGSEFLTSVGQKVNKGDIIMKVGSTGLSTGPHLHFAVMVSGQYVNPWPYLTGTSTEE